MNRLAAAVVVFIAAASAAQAEVTFEGQFVQGGLVLAHTAPGSTVLFEGRGIRVSPSGDFLIGFGRDAGAHAALEITAPDGTKDARTLTVAPRQWDIQRIDGLPERQVTPPAEDLARIKDDVAATVQARTRDTPEWLYKGFVWPTHGPISGVYGSQRILNGQPRTPHFGLDIAAPTGTPVVAPADGIVSLVKDMFFTGHTLMLDHGYGLNTTYSHLSQVQVKPGERVKQGQVIGKVGATGRVTGAHLDWRVNLFDIRLDPALLLPTQ